MLRAQNISPWCTQGAEAVQTYSETHWKPLENGGSHCQISIILRDHAEIGLSFKTCWLIPSGWINRNVKQRKGEKAFRLFYVIPHCGFKLFFQVSISLVKVPLSFCSPTVNTWTRKMSLSISFPLSLSLSPSVWWWWWGGVCLLHVCVHNDWLCLWALSRLQKADTHSGPFYSPFTGCLLCDYGWCSSFWYVWLPSCFLPFDQSSVFSPSVVIVALSWINILFAQVVKNTLKNLTQMNCYPNSLQSSGLLHKYSEWLGGCWTGCNEMR